MTWQFNDFLLDDSVELFYTVSTLPFNSFTLSMWGVKKNNIWILFISRSRTKVVVCTIIKL